MFNTSRNHVTQLNYVPYFTVEKGKVSLFSQGYTANKELSQNLISGPQTPRLSAPNSLFPEDLTWISVTS